MRKLIAVGVLVGGLLAGAGSVMAQPVLLPGGVGDPLALATGVLIPYLTGAAGGTVALIEIASPVAPNPNLQMVFYDDSCARVGSSAFVPETVNDIAFVNPVPFVPAGTRGLAAILGSDVADVPPVPLTAPIHSRVYEFNPLDGRSWVFEPIIVDTAEFGVASGNNSNTWSPLRTAATFYAPLETATVHTELTLVCPRFTIQGGTLAAFGAASPSEMKGVVYDTDENPLININFTCDCLTPNFSVASISPIFGMLPAAALGTYTKIAVTTTSPEFGGPFTGYRAVFSVGSPQNNFFGRLSNGSRASIFGGTVTNAR